MLIPQIEGGFGPPEFDTLKVSVRHCVNSVTLTVPSGTTTPDLSKRFATDTVLVLGPEMENDWKSSLSWNRAKNVFVTIFNQISIHQKV